MKIRISILTVIIFTLLFTVTCKQQAGDDGCYWSSSPDTITGASAQYYRGENVIKGKELFNLLRNIMSKDITFALATVRCDGTANIAAVMPYAISEDTIVIVMADNTTKKNILATKNARAIIRYSDKKTAKGMDIYGNVGSRLNLQLIDDNARCEKLFKENQKMLNRMMAKSVKDCVFLKIKEVYPLG